MPDNDPTILPFAPPAEDDEPIEIIPCSCNRAACAECNPGAKAGPDPGLLAAAEAALPVLGALCGNPAVRPVFTALFDAVERARGGK
jgi:hypothetical protein